MRVYMQSFGRYSVASVGYLHPAGAVHTVS